MDTRQDEDKTKSQDRINFVELSVQNIAVACTIKGQNVKLFLNTLKSLNFTTNTEVHLSKIGMKIIAEESQFFQGAAFFCNKFFSRFHYSKKAPELVSFGMEFVAFTEFLSALINNDLASLKIVYYGDHRPIAYILRQRDNVIDQNATLSDFEDDDDETQQQNRPNKEIVTEYVIRTKHSINPIDFTSINSPRASVVMMDSHELIEIISDIDKTTDEIQFKIDERAFVVRTLGIIQCNTQIPFPSNHKIFKKFEHHKDTTFSYKFNCFKSMLKALANSVEVCVETKENGLLKIQIMGKSTDVIGSLYYEFSIMPNVSEEDVDIEII